MLLQAGMEPGIFIEIAARHCVAAQTHKCRSASYGPALVYGIALAIGESPHKPSTSTQNVPSRAGELTADQGRCTLPTAGMVNCCFEANVHDRNGGSDSFVAVCACPHASELWFDAMFERSCHGGCAQNF